MTWSWAMWWGLSLVVVGSGGAEALRCWRCGQYSDGVGSITPCTNHSAARLTDCQPEANYCIKYVSELTVVRDCVPTCTEKEWWGARTYCCKADACNAAGAPSPRVLLLAVAFAAPLLAAAAALGAR